MLAGVEAMSSCFCIVYKEDSYMIMKHDTSLSGVICSRPTMHLMNIGDYVIVMIIDNKIFLIYYVAKLSVYIEFHFDKLLGFL